MQMCSKWENGHSRYSRIVFYKIIFLCFKWRLTLFIQCYGSSLKCPSKASCVHREVPVGHRSTELCMHEWGHPWRVHRWTCVRKWDLTEEVITWSPAMCFTTGKLRSTAHLWVTLCLPDAMRAAFFPWQIRKQHNLTSSYLNSHSFIL